MRILIDMNLSPDWVRVLESAGHEAVHWSSVGSHDAPDRELFHWAKTGGYTVLTHDLDFERFWQLQEHKAQVLYKSAHKTFIRSIWDSSS